MTTIIVKTLKTTQNKNRKRNKIVIVMSKWNLIEALISQALINNEISHEDFMTTINGEKTIRN